jgi:clan AA aspartic protease (TIGR02281 family)
VHESSRSTISSIAVGETCEEQAMLTANRAFWIVTSTAIVAAIWYSQPSSRTCPSSSAVSTWTDCVGSIALAGGDQLSGPFKAGKIAGTATYRFASGDRYIGEVSELSLKGRGTYFFSNGTRYVGELSDGKFNGQGTLYYSNGDQYVGQFRNDRLNGRGAITYADGSKYVGEFKDDRPTGRGNFAVAPVTLKLIERNGLFELPVRLNDVITLNAAIDSGASQVVIPADVFKTLRRTGTFDDEDELGEEVAYKLADGSVQKGLQIRIRSITVGVTTVTDVIGIVISDDADQILLGQSFLRRFKSVSLDNQKQTITLYQ